MVYNTAPSGLWLVKLARQSIFVLQAKQPRTPICLPLCLDQQVHNGLKHFFYKLKHLSLKFTLKVVLYFQYSKHNRQKNKASNTIWNKLFGASSNDVNYKNFPAPLPYDAKDRLIGESNWGNASSWTYIFGIFIKCLFSWCRFHYPRGPNRVFLKFMKKWLLNPLKRAYKSYCSWRSHI